MTTRTRTNSRLTIWPGPAIWPVRNRSFLNLAVFVTVAAVCMLNRSGRGQDAVPIAPDVFQFPPDTPHELVEAASITQQLDRPDDSRAFLRLALEQPLDDEGWRGLRTSVGIDVFLRLNSDPRMQPEAADLLRKINAATQPQPLTADEIRQLVQSLGESDSTAASAVQRLLAAGDAAAAELLAADPGTIAGGIAAELLSSHPSRFRHGLLAAMETADSERRIRILNLLSATGDDAIALRLLRWRFAPDVVPEVAVAAESAIRQMRPPLTVVTSAAQAADLLVREAGVLIQRAGARFSGLDRTSAERELDDTDDRAEAIARASMLLSDALSIDPGHAGGTSMSVVARCAMVNASLTAEASAAASLSGPEVLSALDTALDLENPRAAIELLRGLRQLPTAEVDTAAVEVLLRTAIDSPDARVRLLAALLASRKFAADVSAAAIRRTRDAAVSGSERPEAVVVGANQTESDVLSAVLTDAGFAVKTAGDGVEGFEAAASQLTCELFVLSADTWRWPLATTIANLRSDVRTRNTPILITGLPRWEDRVRKLARHYPGIYFVPSPISSDTLQSISREIDFPADTDTAIARRNTFWDVTFRQLNLPAPVLTEADRTIMKFLAENQP